MTSNNEYYQSILNTVSGETITTYETTLNLMKRICLAYGCTYSSAQCSNQYLKDFAEASIGTTYSENKLNIEYLHDIALNFYPLTDEGTENYYLGIIADYITVTPKLYTDLTIDVPLVLVYSDEFDITGVLTDENDDPVENANISLLVGNTIVDTATTDSTGTVEFTQAPVSMGNHTFQLIFNGNSECYSTSSSTVSRTINKETSVLNVSLPLDGANYYDYENIAVTGTLYDNDGELIDNATVKVYNSSTLLESVNVSNGSFSISNLTDIAGTLGDYTLTIIYEGNDYYTASSVTRTIHIVEEILYDDLTLTSTESILSYYDSEYVDLTAQLTYEGSDVALSGVAIDFYVDNVLVDSVDTNNSGRSVYRYNSTGAGDVTIEAKIGTSVSETFVLEDLWAYIQSGTLTPTSNPQYEEIFDLQGIGDVEITGVMSASNKGFGFSYANIIIESSEPILDDLRVGIDGGNYYAVWSYINSSQTNHTRNANRQYSTNSNLNFTIKKVGTSVTMKLNDLTYTFTYTPTDLRYFKLINWNNTSKTINYSNIKVKKL